jgi:hypothetical protein
METNLAVLRIWCSYAAPDSTSVTSVFRSFRRPVARNLLWSSVGLPGLASPGEAEHPGHDDESYPRPTELFALETDSGPEQHQTDQREGNLGPR